MRDCLYATAYFEPPVKEAKIKTKLPINLLPLCILGIGNCCRRSQEPWQFEMQFSGRFEMQIGGVFFLKACGSFELEIASCFGANTQFPGAGT